MTKPKAKAAAAAAKPAVKSTPPKAPTPATKVVAQPAAKSSKSPAAKPAAKAAVRPASPPAGKSSVEPAAGPVSKPAGKTDAIPGAKPAVKSVPKAVSATSTKSAAKSVPEPVLKAPAATAAAAPANAASKPAAKAGSKSAVAAAAPAAVAVGVAAVAAKPAPAVVKPPSKPSSRSARGIPPVAPASPPSNRFTDRFAPARHVKAPDPIEVQKSSYKADPKLVNAWKSKPGRELSVPELLAMPDSEYMNDKQVDFFRTLLRGQRDELLSNAGETTEHLREDTTIVPDPADRATIEEEHALELRTRDRERKLLKKISQSLTRLDSNEYGFCDETGEPIGLNRLLARPTATLSLEAQQRRELKQKMFGD